MSNRAIDIKERERDKMPPGAWEFAQLFDWVWDLGSGHLSAEEIRITATEVQSMEDVRLHRGSEQ